MTAFFLYLICYGYALNEEVEVRHPIQGNFADTLKNVSFDVDSSRSYSVKDTKYWIENAEKIAAERNNALEMNSKFHFWPNIFNLTEIYYHDPSLYNQIIAEILEREPDKKEISEKLGEEIEGGERVFLARDFITVLEHNQKTYYEVHYALIINLDSKYYKELIAHDFKEFSALHDPHTEKLSDAFKSAHAPIGVVWELCLRGNLKRQKYNSIIVDKLDYSKPEFFIERIHLSCHGSYYCEEELTELPPLVPRPKEPPPWEPEEEIPVPPRNPRHPKPPPVYLDPEKPGEGIPPVRPWPFGYPETGETTPFPGTEAGEDEPESETECPESDEKINEKKELLEEMKKEFEELKKEFNEDIRTINEKFKCYPGQWEDNASFNTDCVQEIYDKFNEEIQELKKQIDELQEELSEMQGRIEKLKEEFCPVTRAFIYRNSIWSNMLQVGGEWSNVTVPCGGGILMPGHSSGVGARVEVTPEQQREFQRNVAYALMSGKTWEEAVSNAVTKGIPEGDGWGESVWKEVWAIYANCLKELHTKQLNIYLRLAFPDASDEQINEMINAMFDGEKALSQDKKDLLEKNRKAIAEIQREQDELIKKITENWNKINDLRREFRAEIREKCLDKTREDIERKRHEIWILESFLEWCNNPSGEYEFNYTNRETLCKTLQAMLKNPKFNQNSGLKGFIELLLKNHCRELTGHPSVLDYINSEMISAQFTSTGSASDHVANLTIQSNVFTQITLNLENSGLRGMILENPDKEEQDLVITGVPGILTKADAYIPAKTATLNQGEKISLPIKGNCANFEKKNPSPGIILTLGNPIEEEVQRVIIILEEKEPELKESFSSQEIEIIKQVSIWMAQPENKENSAEEYAVRGYPIKEEFKPVIGSILTLAGTSTEEITLLSEKEERETETGEKETEGKETEKSEESELPLLLIGTGVAGIIVLIGIYKFIIKK